MEVVLDCPSEAKSAEKEDRIRRRWGMSWELWRSGIGIRRGRGELCLSQEIGGRGFQEGNLYRGSGMFAASLSCADPGLGL